MLKLAHFPTLKELASFDVEAQPSIDPKQIRDLVTTDRQWRELTVARAARRR
ncbi:MULTISPECIES: hypothetical protein [Bradyrhizobium]|uniref:hypothetical protein n=1 Tax=Bradyrhizobium TaxID=374 RepID=UPI00293E2DB2|nr:hypothetical protein [Bradyrhizobium sp. BWC-3-1]WOH62676.1 hypothetical protein RX329_28065 [Bradyrhizobium sp. BWC-3-1]